MFGKRILILAAHPDDEVVACAAAIGRARTHDAEIFVLFLTDGCIPEDVMWPWDRRNHEKYVARRRAEGEAAAQFLGVTPVGWSTRPARHLWRSMPAARRAIEAAIDQNEIDQLWVPAYEGGNADHDALNALGSVFSENGPNPLPLVGRVREGGPPQDTKLAERPLQLHPPPPNLPHEGGGIPYVLEFAEYNFFDGKAHSQEFPFPDGNEQTLILTSAEQEKKRAALALYKSEKRNLNYVKTERECWRPLPVYDYTKSPHEGMLWYTRFQWVPFRHPRVDFTKPEEVSEAIMGFLKSRS